MSMRFKNQNEAEEWLEQTKGNRKERDKLDENQKWSLRQAFHACNNIIGGFENMESDEGTEVELLHGDRQKLIDYIYFNMQREEYCAGGEMWNDYIGKRHGYSTKNFVLGAIDYHCKRNGY